VILALIFFHAYQNEDFKTISLANFSFKIITKF